MQAHAHKRAPPPFPPPQKHFLWLVYFNSIVFLGLTCWLHMQQHVPRVSNPSSKQIANHTDRKYVLFLSGQQPRITGWPVQSVSTLPRFLKEEKKKSYLATYLQEERVHFFIYVRQNTVPFT